MRDENLVVIHQDEKTYFYLKSLHLAEKGIGQHCRRLIGHIKSGGQLNRSRMKSDKAIEASGYSAVFGFNLRQLIRHNTEKIKREAA